MKNKYREFEKELLEKIKNGKGKIYQIMVLSREYKISSKKLNKILEKQMVNNRIIWSGSKYSFIDNMI